MPPLHYLARSLQFRLETVERLRAWKFPATAFTLFLHAMQLIGLETIRLLNPLRSLCLLLIATSVDSCPIAQASLNKRK